MSNGGTGNSDLDTQERWRLLLDSTAEAILSTTLDGVCTFCNATSLRLLGYQSESDLVGRNLHEVIHHSYPDGTPYPAHSCRTCQIVGRGEAIFVRDEVFWRRDGSSFPVEYHAAPQWKDGAVVGTVVTFLDMTERKEMETALKASEQRYLTLTEVSPVGIFHTDAEGTFLYVNERWCEITGFSRDEALRKGLAWGVHPEDRDRVLEEWCSAAGADRSFRSEYRIRHTDGSVSWVYGQMVSEKNSAGKVLGYVGTITDITDRKMAEEKLLERNQFIEAVVDNLPIGFGVMTCHDRKVVYLNQMMEKILGWPGEILTDEEAFWEHAFPDPDYRQEVRAKVYETRKRALAAPASLEYRVTKSTAEPADIFTVYIPMLDRDLLITACQDLTERKRTEEALRQSELRRVQLQAELNLAAEVQKMLLPQGPCSVPGFEIAAFCRPARQVGGDFYDWYETSPGIMTITFGDVMGKGMAAAMLMTAVRATLRAVTLRVQPSIAVQQAERSLRHDLDRSERFVTLFLARLNYEASLMTFVDCGHGFACLRRRDGKVEELLPRGLPLGVSSDEEYIEGGCTFQGGDALILYSDGLIDTLPEFALDNAVLSARLEGAESAGEMVRRIGELVPEGTPLEDDLTVLVLRRNLDR